MLPPEDFPNAGATVCTECVERRVAKSAVEAMSTLPTDPWWWLSFAGDGGNLGVSIVQAPNMGAAVVRAHLLGINPGGEVKGVMFTEDMVPPDFDVSERALTREQIEQEMDR
jgi:hypothetical protein